MTLTSRVRAAVVTVFAGAALVGAASPALGDSTAPTPTVVSVSYASYPYGSSFMADSVYADWAGTPIVNRVYGTPGQATNAPNMLLNPFPSIFRDSGTPRSRLSYHVGVCSPECDNGGIDDITWGPWFHPYVPAQVTASAPALTATSPTKSSPGIKITINPGDQAGAPMYLLYNTGAPVARIPSDNLSYVDTDPYRPKNSYQVRRATPTATGPRGRSATGTSRCRHSAHR